MRTIYKKLVVSMISKELAIASRIKVERINLIYLFLVAIIVAVGIKEVGTLLVGALVIVPAAAAKNISSTLSRYSLMSDIFVLPSAPLGISLSNYVNVPAGPLVEIVGARPTPWFSKAKIFKIVLIQLIILLVLYCI